MFQAVTEVLVHEDGLDYGGTFRILVRPGNLFIFEFFNLGKAWTSSADQMLLSI